MMKKVAQEEKRSKIKSIFRLEILQRLYIILVLAFLFIIVPYLPLSVLNILDTVIPERYFEPLISVPIFVVFILALQIFISLSRILKLVLFPEKIIPFDDLNTKENLYKYNGKKYSGEAFIEKNNMITDKFIFKKGKKISHIKTCKNGRFEFEEQWYYKGINAHPEGIYEPLGEERATYKVSSKQIIISKYKTWHNNGQLAQRLITYKNGEESEIRFDENGNALT